MTPTSVSMDCSFRHKYGPTLRAMRDPDAGLVSVGVKPSVSFRDLSDAIEAVTMDLVREAHVQGRIYQHGGEKAKPSEVEDRLRRKVQEVLGLAGAGG